MQRSHRGPRIGQVTPSLLTSTLPFLLNPVHYLSASTTQHSKLLYNPLTTSFRLLRRVVRQSSLRPPLSPLKTDRMEKAPNPKSLRERGMEIIWPC